MTGKFAGVVALSGWAEQLAGMGGAAWAAAVALTLVFAVAVFLAWLIEGGTR